MNYAWKRMSKKDQLIEKLEGQIRWLEERNRRVRACLTKECDYDSLSKQEIIDAFEYAFYRYKESEEWNNKLFGTIDGLRLNLAEQEKYIKELHKQLGDKI